VRRPRLGVWTRTDRLEAALTRAALRRDCQRIAHVTGVDPEELLREAEALVGRARAAGAITWEQINAFAGAELGVDPAALQADVDQVATWGRL
jgi:hypothetical protein